VAFWDYPTSACVILEHTAYRVRLSAATATIEASRKVPGDVPEWEIPTWAANAFNE
jgi:hypothetical protein